MEILSGIKISTEIQIELQNEVLNVKTQGVTPCLAVILVGDDPASRVYVRRKKEMCAKLGIESIEKRLNKDAPPEKLLQIINELNENSSVNGILCQVPLPPQHDEEKTLLAIDPSKDVDCFHPYNVGLLAIGAAKFMPCTPMGVLQVLKRSGHETSGKKIVILGRSNIVGRPLSILMSLKGMDGTVTVCHSRTKDIPQECAKADILIAAIGKPKFVTKEYVKPGAIVIDVGINRIDADNKKGFRLVGDVDWKSIEGHASAATPVPGGIGPLTIIMLMYNTINAARLQNHLDVFPL